MRAVSLEGNRLLTDGAASPTETVEWIATARHLQILYDRVVSAFAGHNLLLPQIDILDGLNPGGIPTGKTLLRTPPAARSAANRAHNLHPSLETEEGDTTKTAVQTTFAPRGPGMPDKEQKPAAEASAEASSEPENSGSSPGDSQPKSESSSDSTKIKKP